MANEQVLAYLAGVIDSDGCINIQRSTYAARHGVGTQPTYSPKITVKQVAPQAIDLSHETFGGGRWLSGPSAQKGRQLHVWSIHSAMAGRVLEQLLPHLRIKLAQAENAVEVCRINAGTRRRYFEFPDVIDGEPMVTLAEAARRLGKSYAVVYQAVVQHKSVPHVRTGPRKVLVPESYLAVWAERGHSPGRVAELSDRLEACYRRSRVLNKVGV